MSHTPGPWVVKHDWYISHPDGIGAHAYVCAPIKPSMTEDEHKANAKLIAAAPEMLDMLRRIETSLDSRDDNPIWIDMRAVIAKATNH